MTSKSCSGRLDTDRTRFWRAGIILLQIVLFWIFRLSKRYPFVVKRSKTHRAHREFVRQARRLRGRCFFKRQTEAVQQAGITASICIWRRQQAFAMEERIGPGVETQGLAFIAHRFAACRQANASSRHHDPCGGDHPHQFENIKRWRILQGRSLDWYE